MKNIMRGNVLYKGIDEYIPENLNTFTQMNVDKTFTLNSDMPNIDEIIKVSIEHNIKNSKIVKTAIGTSLEGQNLTGYKLLSEGVFNLRIDFCADDEMSSIYTFKDNLFFNNCTTLSKESNLNSKVCEQVYVEDIYCQKIDDRDILINISFIFIAEVY
ncbi:MULTISPECIES: hypothetical protein [Peptostreptococcaceae]|uniref:hypothetical protein n=1 Tax=Peptostreptococcaceae TaxID=186804 RepID=UPI003F2BC16A